jgi:hypothetical protein
MRAARIITAAALIAGASLAALLADEEPRGPGGEREGQRKGGRGGNAPIEDLASLFRTDVPTHPLDVILARPTKFSVTVSVLAFADREGIIQYGPNAGTPTAKTGVFALKANEPAEAAITGLQPDTQYSYRLSTRAR